MENQSNKITKGKVIALLFAVVGVVAFGINVLNYMSSLTLETRLSAAVLDSSSSGLMNRYSFDNSSAGDSIGGKNGSIYGADFVSGKSGQALSFNGGSDRVVVSSDPIGSGPVTVSAWVKLNSYKGSILNNVTTQLGVVDWDKKIYFTSHYNVGTAISESSSLSLNTWVFVAATRDANGSATIYINGSRSGSSNQNSGSPAAGGSLVMGNRAEADMGLDGSIDDLRIYNRVLSSSEISSLYSDGASSSSTTPPPSTPPPAESPKPENDTAAPIISSISSSNITANKATIKWKTNESSDTQVEYGLTTTYGSSAILSSNLVKNHTSSLTNLTPNTVYHYHVTSKDVAGNLGVSPDKTFTTSAGVVTAPLQVQSVTAVPADQTVEDSLTPTLPEEVDASGDIVGNLRSAGRTIDWTKSGVTGGIDQFANRQSCGPALNPQSTAALNTTAINNAISSCGANGGVVYLNAGTYSTNGPISINRSNITLRGAGPESTIVRITPNAYTDGGIRIFGSNTWNGNIGGNIRDWTGGYSQGATTLTIGNTTTNGSPLNCPIVNGINDCQDLVGKMIIVDQLQDVTLPVGAVPCTDSITSQNCVSEEIGRVSVEGESFGRSPGTPSSPLGSPDGYRPQQQYVKVISASGNTINIYPGLYLSNWRASRHPQIWWPAGTIENVGVEDMTVTTYYSASSTNAFAGIKFSSVYGGWVKNVKSLYGSRNHIWLYLSSKIEIRNSYFFGDRLGSTSYGIEAGPTGDAVIVNNIFDKLGASVMVGNATGIVVADNYLTSYPVNDDRYWMGAGLDISHDAGSAMNLFEGNVAPGVSMDLYHGAAALSTMFRNQLHGYEKFGEPGHPDPNHPGQLLYTHCPQNQFCVKNDTIPVDIWAYNRSVNMVGNILGTDGWHDKYQALAPDHPANNPAAPDPNHSIYVLGYPGVQNSTMGCIPYHPCRLPPPPCTATNPCSVPHVDLVLSDPKVVSTMLRWGNFDYYNDQTRFVASEIPSDVTVPASQSLPASLYSTSRPSFWVTPWGTPPWPAIGPDVSGLVQDIPAKRCFDHLTTNTNGAIDSRGAKLFTPNTCYGSGGGPVDTTDPSVPTGVNIPSSSVTSSSLTLNWNNSTDNVGVASYNIYRTNGSQSNQFNSSTNSFTNTNLLPETTYSYKVSAVDTSGNESNQSSPAVSATTDAIILPQVTEILTIPQIPAAVLFNVGSGFEGDYRLIGNVTAPHGGANSVFIDIDNPPGSVSGGPDDYKDWDMVVGSSTQNVSWYGDGTTAPQFNPKIFTNLSVGPHSLNINPRESGTGVQSIKFIKVTPTTNQPPSVGAGVDQTITLPSTAKLAGTASDDGLPTGSHLTTTWSKKSGPGTVTFLPNANSLTASSSFSQSGTYVLTLTGSDGTLSSTDEVTITVNPVVPDNQPPSLSFIGPRTVTAGTNLTINVSATDPNITDTPTSTLTGSPLPLGVTYTWVSSTRTGTLSWTPTQSQVSSQPYSMRITVDDHHGGIDFEDFLVTVTAIPNQPPTLDNIPPHSTNDGVNLQFTLTASDPNNDTLSYTSSNLPAGATLSSSGTFSWTPSVAQVGSYTVHFTVSDGRGGTNTKDGLVTVTHINRPPTSNAGPDQTITIVTSPVTATLSGSASTDPDGNTLTYTWSKESGPFGANVTFSPNANVVGPTVALPQSGEYVFKLTVSDGSLSASDTVKITVNNPSSGVQDQDHDGIFDQNDVCPGTPVQNPALSVNARGCPYPKYANFGTHTALFYVDLKAVSSFEIGNSSGKVSYGDKGTPYMLVKQLSSNSYGQLNIDSNLTITPGTISLNSSGLPELDRPATLSFYNITIPNPQILQDGDFCDECKIVSYTGTTLVITVPGFSTYTVIGGGAPILSNIDADDISKKDATITWNTDIQSDSKVYYGKTTSYGSAKYDSNLSTSHSIKLTGLKSNTTYHYKVESKGANGLISTSADGTFKTSSSGGGGGGGGGGNNPPPDTNNGGSTPPQGPVEGCLPGYTFSQTTGQRCPLTSTGGTASYNFTSNLTIGSRNSDVVQLQLFLISKGHLAQGLNTGFFGVQTQLALMRYQLSVGITPATGYFGPITRSRLNGATPESPIVLPPPSPLPPSQGTPRHIFTIPTNPGERNADIPFLQDLLVSKGFLTANSYTRGLFDQPTVQAVGKLQIQYGIFRTQLDDGWGLVGPMTRGVLNTI